MAGVLIADYSGQALIRLADDVDGTATRTRGQESAQRLPLSEGGHGRVLARQDVEVLDDAPGVQVLAR